MKLQITIHDQPMSGYQYINPMYGQDIYNLDNIVSDNECTEIFADKIIDFISISNMFNMVSHWIKKLRHGGILVIGGTDCYELSRNYVLGNLNTLEFNNAMFGNQESPWNMKQSSMSLKDLVDLMGSVGLHVMKKRVYGVQMVVEAKRD